jgi:DNA-directed RNA polymerase specialized sigma24 family protein
MKQSEIARQLNCSPQQVSRLMRRARARMQELVDPPVHAPDVAARPGRVTRPG